MYVVKIKGGQTVAICSRKVDAEAYLVGQRIDKTIYEILEFQPNLKGVSNEQSTWR